MTYTEHDQPATNLIWRVAWTGIAFGCGLLDDELVVGTMAAR
jgi:hypothetical protein